MLQVAVCNLASIALNMYVTPERTFDFQKLASVTKVIVRNLNKIIDINYYPVPEVRFHFIINSFPSVLRLLSWCWNVVCILYLYRQRNQTNATDPLVLEFRGWPTPLSWCVSLLKVTKLNCLTFRFLKLSTMQHWRPAVSWRLNMAHMRHMLDHQLVRE